MTNPNLIPTTIVDKNGKTTTVRRSPLKDTGGDSRSYATSNTPSSTANTVSDFRRMPSIELDTTTPLNIRRKMGGNIYEFATEGGGETNVFINSGTPDSIQSQLRGYIARSETDEESNRMKSILLTETDDAALKQATAHGRAMDYAMDHMENSLPVGAMQAIYRYGRILDAEFPNLTDEQKGNELKERLGAEITAPDTALNYISADKIWAGYNAYAGYMEAEDSGLYN